VFLHELNARTFYLPMLASVLTQSCPEPRGPKSSESCLRYLIFCLQAILCNSIMMVLAISSTTDVFILAKIRVSLTVLLLELCMYVNHDRSFLAVSHYVMKNLTTLFRPGGPFNVSVALYSNILQEKTVKGLSTLSAYS
jgi:type III secretory pathway component EscV